MPLNCERKATTLLRSGKLASPEPPTEQVLRFAVENGRVLVTLDADFANVMRFPPEQTLGVVRLNVHPATEERIRQTIRQALLFLQNIDVAGRLAVVDEDKIRIRR